MSLEYGDFTFQKSFSLVQVRRDGSRLIQGFKPQKGHEFVTLLIGEAKVGELPDLDTMMAKIGITTDKQGAVQILRLKEEIADLKKQLADALADKAV